MADSRLPGLDRVLALGAYDGVLRRAVRRFKFDGRRDLAKPLGEAIGRMYRACLAIGPAPAREAANRTAGGKSRPDARPVMPRWVSIPPHPHRLRDRGYDHTALLARAACRGAGIGAFAPGALVRVVDTPPLYRLSREERAAVLAGAFGAPRPIAGPIVLVDDILTTGATARTAASVLRAAGATRVDLVVVARA